MDGAILNNVKLLLGINDKKSDLMLRLLIDDTEEAVKAYCRIETVPEQLYGLIARMTAEQYQNGSFGTTKQAKTITSKTQGSKSESYGDAVKNLITDYADRLRPFVNKRGYIPSEVKRV